MSSDLIQLDSLPVETLAEMANEAAAACEASGRKTVEHAIRCGRALLAAKAKVKHGEWGDWLGENFHHSHRRATQYMEVANWNARSNLESAETIQGALRMIADSPEKQAKRQEREAKKQEQQPQKAEATPKPPAPAPPAPAPPQKLERPAWLADPDELERPEEDDLPPLPRTNTHHTTDNRRTPDARETDRIGIVPPDDPRTYHDGHWYAWSEDRGRMVAVTDEEILRRADEIRDRRGARVQQVMPVIPWPPETAPVVEHAKDTTQVVEHKRDSVSSKRFTPPTAHEVSVYSDEINAGVDGQQFVDFYESKGWMIGKNKMKDWKAAVRTWKRSESQRGPKISTAVRSNRNWDEEIPEWKPTE